MQPQSEDLENWVTRLWYRMDRDGSGSITRQELDCEEFHNAICSALTPESFQGSLGGATYARVQMNMLEAIKFCIRKADQNGDNSLSFEEFRSLMLSLRQPQLAQHSANLVFALFDLDNSRQIDKAEFHELLRFFLARNPTEEEYQEEWGRIAPAGEEVVTHDQYIRWLRKSPNPAFKQYAPNKAYASADGKSMFASGSVGRPEWNKRFNAGPTLQHANESKPCGQREFFSKAQSLPELKRFYNTYKGFNKQRTALDTPAQQRATSALWPKSLSSEGGLGRPLVNSSVLEVAVPTR